MLEDVKIIELFFARTEQAIAELAAKYGSTCKRIANNILKCEPDAEECVAAVTATAIMMRSILSRLRTDN